MRDFHELRGTGSPKQLIKSRVLPCIFLIDGFNMVGRFQVVIAEPVTPSFLYIRLTSSRKVTVSNTKHF